MEPLVSRLIAQAAPKASTCFRPVFWPETRLTYNGPPRQDTERRSSQARRPFTRSAPRHVKLQGDVHATPNLQDVSHSQPAEKVSQTIGNDETSHFHKIEAHSKERQRRSPWMREGSDRPPVARNRSAGAMTKGKLLTTPSRMLKLIMPMTTRDVNKDRKNVEPLALLVHPQQPLSYLERLIQSELPLIHEGDKDRSPNVVFRAEDSMEEDIGSGKSAVEKAKDDKVDESQELEFEDTEEVRIDGKVEKTGKLRSNTEAKSSAKSGPHEPAPDPEHSNFVRWSPSTEIGDFIRDASRGKEFSVEIEGAPPIYIGVPSFDDRTYYLRMRLRKTARRIAELATLKRECDDIAQRGAKRVAQAGFAGLLSWWLVVYWLTFKTDLGWDVMEPVTYLVGLSGFIGGYIWFLSNNREVSYRAAMNLTVSRRQAKLYEQKGFDIMTWEGLVEEGNRLRREIKMVADEYDVDWDEAREEGDEKVTEALRKARRKKSEAEEDKKEKDEDKDED